MAPNPSYWWSFCLLVSQSAKHWGLFVSGALASLFGWILYAMNVQSVPTRYFIWAGIGLLVLAVFRAFHDVRIERDALITAQEPRLEIVFEEPQSSHHSAQPYLQTLEYQRIGSNGSQVWHDRRYRIGVRNLSTEVIPKVSVKLAKCQPALEGGLLGHRLLVMDSDPPEGERDLPTTDTGEPTLWFDVVNENGVEWTLPSEFYFCFANPNLRSPITHNQRVTISLLCEGGSASSRRDFIIERGEIGRLHMRPV